MIGTMPTIEATTGKVIITVFAYRYARHAVYDLSVFYASFSIWIVT